MVSVFHEEDNISCIHVPSHSGLYRTVPVDATLARLLQPYITNLPQHLNRYGRLIRKNTVYHGTIYERPVKFTISYTLPSSHNEHVESFGVISYFFTLSQDIYAVVEPLLLSDIKLVDPAITCLHTKCNVFSVMQLLDLL